MDLPKDISVPELSLSSYVGVIAYVVQAVVVLVLIFYFFVPTYREIRTLQDDIDVKKTELQSITEYAAYLEDLANSTLAVEEDVVNYALPSENDVVTLILTYEGLAASNEDLTVSPVSLSPGVLTQETDALEEGETGLQMVSFGMEATGTDTEAFFSLIDQITKTRRIFDIETLGLIMPSEDGSQDITLTLGLSTYYYIESPVTSNRSLVKQGQTQADFIAQLRDGIVYEDLILESVELGKEDLFARDASFTPPSPTPQVIEEAENETNLSTTQIEELDDTVEASPEEIEQARQGAGPEPQF